MRRLSSPARPIFPRLASIVEWEQVRARVTEQQMDFQMQADGVHFEQSTYYHVYAVDFFLLHRIFARGECQEYDDKLRAGIEYLQAILGPRWEIPFIGDDDGGRFFHPFGDRASLDVRRWRLPPWSSMNLHGSARQPISPNRRFGGLVLATVCSVFPAQSTFTIISRRRAWQCLPSQTFKLLLMPAPFGWGSAGHSHSDTLGLTLTAGAEEIARRCRHLYLCGRCQLARLVSGLSRTQYPSHRWPESGTTRRSVSLAGEARRCY